MTQNVAPEVCFNRTLVNLLTGIEEFIPMHYRLATSSFKLYAAHVETTDVAIIQFAHLIDDLGGMSNVLDIIERNDLQVVISSNKTLTFDVLGYSFKLTD